MRKIKHLVVHCSDTPNEREDTAEDIHRWHLERGWSGIGYPAVIRRDGMLEYGRPPYWEGAHVRGHNEESLGICLIGRDEFTEAQMLTLEGWLRLKQYQYPGAEAKGHGDLDSGKTCPNFDVPAWWYSRRSSDID